MRLRSRLALAIVTVTVPQIVALFGWDLHSRRVAARQGLVALADAYLDPAYPEFGRACVASPQTFGPDTPPPGDPFGPFRRENERLPEEPHGKPPLIWAYAGDGTPASPGAPPAPARLDELREGVVTLLPLPWLGSDVRVAARTGWGDPCAVVVIEGSTVPGWKGAVLPATEVWLVPLLTSLLGTLVAAGSVVARIRRLASAVRDLRSGGSRELPLDGDDEVAELAHAFDDTRRALQGQIGETRNREEALRTFLANTTHDVLVPLTVLRSHLTDLRTQSELGPIAPATLLSAMDEAQYLGSLVHNLAAAAQLDASAHPTERHPVDLNALVERVVARHRPIARPRGIELHHAVPDRIVWVSGDVTLLEQAVNNLVYNAIRHNRERGHAAIVLDAVGAGFSLRVFDDGPGVSPELLPRLGERGFRTDDARSRSREGQGLGLSIVVRVVEAHGFALGFARSEHGGLEARITG